MDFKDGVEFDPGFVKHVSPFIPNIEYLYETLNKFKNFGQKKLQFKIFYPKIQVLLNTYMSFYLGCLLWAVFIKTMDNKPILNNLCYGGEYSQEETLSEVDFIEKFVEQLKKDVKYYLGQNFSFDSASQNILEAYRGFLILNKGFTTALNTNDLKLPDTLKAPNQSDCDIIMKKIEEVTQTGKLAELYQLYEKIF